MVKPVSGNQVSLYHTNKNQQSMVNTCDIMRIMMRGTPGMYQTEIRRKLAFVSHSLNLTVFHQLGTIEGGL